MLTWLAGQVGRRAHACNDQRFGRWQFALELPQGRLGARRSHPGQGADGFAGRLPGVEQLPRRGMPQFECLRAELELAAGARGKEDLVHRRPVAQTQQSFGSQAGAACDRPPSLQTVGERERRNLDLAPAS